jgi:uncharacterized protein
MSAILKKLVLFLSFIFTFLPGYGQDEGVFWKISGNGLQAPSYLFGTVHLICENDFQLGPAVVDKLLKAEALILEIDMDDPALAMSMMGKMHNEGGEKITDYLTETEYTETRELIKERTGMDIDMMKSIRPMMLMSLLYPSLLECETKSFENELMTLAKGKNKEVLGLESVDQQLSFFDQIPLEKQYQSFYEYAGNLEKGKKEFKKLVDTYKKENLSELVDMVSESPEYRDYQNLLLDQRNKDWVDPMKALMSKGSMFFAVGAGHLGGASGLLQLLKDKGFQLERLDVL